MFTLYGIKNCNTVKKARVWLEENNIAYQFHDLRTDGLTQEQLQNFATRVDWTLLLNRTSTSWRKLSPEQQTDLTEDKAIQLIVNAPTLLKRPVLDTGERLLVGFKEQDYQDKLL
jgi:Spx/MgsR family transcriptional regulator